MAENIIDLEIRKRKLVAATKTLRFVNFAIDAVAIIVLSFGLLILLDIAGIMGVEEEINPLLDRLLGTALYVSYYLFFEGVFRGKTLGKLITGTRAVDLDGDNLYFTDVLKRSFSRIVPFEAFSFLGNEPDGWHDRWSDTMVINERQSIR